jgi:hypothetical protein
MKCKITWIEKGKHRTIYEYAEDTLTALKMFRVFHGGYPVVGVEMVEEEEVE